MSRTLKLVQRTPLCVLSIMAICGIVYCWQVMEYHEHDLNFSTSPHAIAFKHQIYRVVTSSFLHNNTFHISLCMIALLSLGTFLECSFGTLWHVTTIFWSMTLVNSFYVLIAFILDFFGVRDVTNWHGLGLSGTIYHLMVIECHLKASSSQSVFDLFRVSSKVYPWVSLFITQIIIPHASFIAHISGILVGHLHTAGFLNYILPSVQRLRLLDESHLLRRISSKENYVKTPLSDDIFKKSFSPSSIERRKTFINAIHIFFKFVGDVAETMQVVIFGSIRDGLNENITPNDEEAPSLLIQTNSDVVEEEQDGRVGLQIDLEKDQLQVV
jgi:membrane associated rhomboid family serine protease